MKILNKLTLGHLIIALFVVVVALVGMETINHIGIAFNEISEQTIPVDEALEEVRTAGLRIGGSTSEFVLIRSENEPNVIALGDTEKEHVRSAIKQYDAAISKYEELVNRFFPDEKNLLENIKKSGNKLQNASNELIALKELGGSGKAVLEKWEELEAAKQEFYAAINDTLVFEHKEFAERKQKIENEIAASMKTILFGGLLTLAAAIGLGVYISRSISEKIIELKNAAVEIGKGKLDTKVNIKSDDEIGILAQCFNQMARSLEEGITERKRVEKVLKESEEHFRSIAQSANNTIITSDSDGNIVFWNNAGQKTFGYESYEVIGKQLSLLMPQQYREAHLKGLERMRTSGESHVIGKTVELEALRKDGSEFPIELSLSTWKTGDKIFYTGILRDITERKNAEKIYQENERLAHASRAKSEFLAVMSHELRTPLNSIIGFSELLKQKSAGELNEKQQRYVDNVNSSGKHLLMTIGDILDLTRVESGKMEINIEKMSVPKAISESVEIIKENAAKKNIKIIKQMSPDIEFIETDQYKFSHVVNNLLCNAVKFSKPEGGTVTITAEKEGDMAKFSISDTGIGIKEEDMVRLFQSFEQLDSGTTRHYGGIGLGLAVSKKLVELHGGKIWAESRYGEGSTFTFLVPLAGKKLEEK